MEKLDKNLDFDKFYETDVQVVMKNGNTIDGFFWGTSNDDGDDCIFLANKFGVCEISKKNIKEIKSLPKMTNKVTDEALKKEEVFYLDDDNNIVDKDLATKFISRETNEKGELVKESFGSFIDNIEDSPKVDEVKEEDIYVDDEMYNFLENFIKENNLDVNLDDVVKRK